METETTTRSEFSNSGKVNVEQILGSEEINKSKRPGLCESVRDPTRELNHLRKVKNCNSSPSLSAPSEQVNQSFDRR